MTFKPVYPFPCRDCGEPVASEADRYKTYRRCRPCGLRNGREKQSRVQARKRGEDVPLLKPGPPATTYPFPCKKCGVEVSNKAERGDAWHLCKPCLRAIKRALKIRQKYGLSPEAMAALEVQHDGICGVCNEPPSAFGLVIDHDHVTGKVRGLLCLACNWMLGHAKDDPARLRAGADFLERS